LCYRERDPEKRAEFVKQLAKLAPSQVVYLDEAGVDHRLYRQYGRAPRGQQIFGEVPGSRGKRISVLGGWFQQRLIAPLVFTGTCNHVIFNTWLEKSLLPELPPNTTLIMDNASFHKTPTTQRLIEAAGCHILYLPPYSPDFNPIEHCWHTIKSWLRPRMASSSCLFSLLCDAICQRYAVA
jgi:transposase